MAFVIPGFKMSGLKAAADLTGKQYHFVKLDTDGNVAAITAITDRPIGILQNEPTAAGMAAEVMCDGVSKIKLDGTSAVADVLGTSDDGSADTIVVGTDETVYACGTCIEGGAVGNIGTILFDCKNPPLAAN